MYILLAIVNNRIKIKLHTHILALLLMILDLPQVYFVYQKIIGEGKIRKGLGLLSGRLITDDEIDLGQVYCYPG